MSGTTRAHALAVPVEHTFEIRADGEIAFLPLIQKRQRRCAALDASSCFGMAAHTGSPPSKMSATTPCSVLKFCVAVREPCKRGRQASRRAGSAATCCAVAPPECQSRRHSRPRGACALCCWRHPPRQLGGHWAVAALRRPHPECPRLQARSAPPHGCRRTPTRRAPRLPHNPCAHPSPTPATYLHYASLARSRSTPSATQTISPPSGAGQLATSMGCGRTLKPALPGVSGDVS